MPEKRPAPGGEEITERLRAELPGWTIAAGFLYRGYRTAGWPTTLMLVNAIGFLSEAAGHHPDLDVGYRNVGVRLRTHDSDAITGKDFALAHEIERLALWRPPEGPLRGPSGAWVSVSGS